jgi:hypothetical protein
MSLKLSSLMYFVWFGLLELWFNFTLKEASFIRPTIWAQQSRIQWSLLQNSSVCWDYKPYGSPLLYCYPWTNRRGIHSAHHLYRCRSMSLRCWLTTSLLYLSELRGWINYRNDAHTQSQPARMSNNGLFQLQQGKVVRNGFFFKGHNLFKIFLLEHFVSLAEVHVLHHYYFIQQPYKLNI